MKLIAIAIAAYLIAFLLQHFIIYKLFIIPQLPAIKSVPLLWWGGYMLPIIIVSLLAGYWSRNLKEIVITSLLSAAIFDLIIYVFARFGEPGYLKAYEGPFYQEFILGCLVNFIPLFTLLLIGYMASKLFVTLKLKRG